MSLCEPRFRRSMGVYPSSGAAGVSEPPVLRGLSELMSGSLAGFVCLAAPVVAQRVAWFDVRGVERELWVAVHFEHVVRLP